MTSPAAAPSAVGDPSTAGAAGPTGVDVASPGRAPRIWLHLGLLCLVLAAVLVLARPSVSTWDEGSYGSQADILRDGSWYGSYRFDDIDPKGAWYPIIYSTRTDQGYVTYARHPFMPWVLSLVGQPLGRAGYVLPSVLGVIGACAASWAVARRVRPGTEVIAFWVAGSGPLLFHASIIWAHAPAAALGGLAVLGAVLVRERRSSWPGHLALVAGLGGVVLLRSEGLLFAGALIGALGLDALIGPQGDEAAGSDEPVGSGGPVVADPVPPRRGRLTAALRATVPAAIAVVLVWLGEQWWIRSIVGPSASPLAVRETAQPYSYLGGRVNGLWASTLSGSGIVRLAPVLPVVFLVVLVVVGGRHRLRRPELVAPAIGAYAVAMVVMQCSAPDQFITGLVPGWPLMSIGVVACGAALWRRQRLLALLVLLAALAIWATQYADGGVFQWGGRFFMVAAVPLAVLAADGLRRLIEEASASGGVAAHRTPVFRAIVLLAVVTAGAQVVGLRATRGNFEQSLDAVEAASGPVIVTTSQELPRLMWKSDASWLSVRSSQLDEALSRLRDQGLDEVSVVASEEAAREAAPAFGTITSRSYVPGVGLWVWTIEAPPAS